VKTTTIILLSGSLLPQQNFPVNNLISDYGRFTANLRGRRNIIAVALLLLLVVVVAVVVAVVAVVVVAIVAVVAIVLVVEVAA
jgi:hypothetical protein